MKSKQGKSDHFHNALSAVNSNINASENDFKVVSTNISNRLSFDELHELLEGMKQQRDYYKTKYDEIANTKAEPAVVIRNNELQDDVQNMREQLDQVISQAKPSVSEVHDVNVSQPDGLVIPKTETDHNEWEYKPMVKKMMSKTFSSQVYPKYVLLSKQTSHGLRMKDGLAVVTGVKSYSGNIEGFEADQHDTKLDQAIEFNKRLMKEKERLIQELRNKDKLFKSEKQKLKDQISNLKSQMTKSQNKVTAYQNLVTKQEKKIESQVSEIKTLLQQKDHVNNQLESEKYISQR